MRARKPMIFFLCLTVVLSAFTNGDNQCDATEKTPQEPLLLRKRNAVFRMTMFNSDSGGRQRGFSRFPEKTIWYYARINKVNVVPNSISIAIENDSIEGHYWAHSEDIENANGSYFRLTYDKANVAVDHAPGMSGYIGLTPNGVLFRTCFPAKKPTPEPENTQSLKNDTNDSTLIRFKNSEAVGRYTSSSGFGAFPAVVHWYSMQIDKLSGKRGRSNGPVMIQGQMWSLSSDVEKPHPHRVEIVFENTDIGHATLRKKMWGYVGLTPNGNLFNAWFPAPPHGSELTP